MAMKNIITGTIFLLLINTSIAQACDIGNSFLTKNKWYEIKKVMKNTSISNTREPTYISDIESIIGSSGNCKIKGGGRVKNCIWIDKNNCNKKIKGIFRDNELAKINKSGF